MVNRSAKKLRSTHGLRFVVFLLIALSALVGFRSATVNAEFANLEPPIVPVSEIVIFDTFGGPSGSLEAHDPNTDLVGQGWTSVRGEWQVGRGRSFDVLGYTQPSVTVIDPEYSDYTVSVDVNWFGGADAGLVFRHQDIDNYFSAVYTGRNFEIRKMLNGVQSTLKRTPLSWDRFETKTITVVVDGANISASVDSKLISTVQHQLKSAQNVGAIVQRTNNDQFKDFEVRALGPQVSPPLISLPSLGDSIIFDEFNGFASLTAHSPDKSPLGTSWTEHNGQWSINGGVVRETTGEPFADLRSTIDAGIADTDIYTHLFWGGGRAGVVYRYIDENNWWMTWVDGNLLLTGSLDSVDGFRLRDLTDIDMPTAGTPLAIRVRLNGHGIRIYVDDGDIPIVRIVNEDHEGATRVGLFSRAGVSNTFSEFVVSESPALPTPDVIPPPGPDPVKNTAPPTPPGLDLYDSFSDYRWTWNGFHPADFAPNSNPWIPEQGHWFVDYDELTDVFGAQSDQRAIIESGVEDSLIATSIKWDSSRTGIVFRYRNENNMAMAWYDGTGLFVVGKIVQGQYVELALIPMEVNPRQTIDLTVWITNDTAHVEVEGDYHGSFDVSDLPNSTGVGLFSRNIEAARFDNLSVSIP